MKRLIFIVVALIVALGFAAPHVDVDFMRPRIERAIERGLGRRVEVGKVYINLFTGPGFTVEDVTVHEDPRAGIEPFIYVRSLEARLRLLGLLSRKLEFSSLRLADDANINLVKTDAGPWNFQFLLGATQAAGMTAINMRGGRVNFKFGDTKSVFYFNDADLDVSPSSEGVVNLRFSGAPSRTDQPQQTFGHFFVRGKWDRQGLDMRVELEPSAIEEVARLFDQHGFGLHGMVALDAQLNGPPSKLDVAGTLRVDDVHRWDLLPKRGGGWSVGYKGTLDLRSERL
ncbi:MAG: AsmA family protein, partial [Acidobacteriia bacterium]|nr:AsmA family protein [Terriglobia bacterium]